MDYAEGTVTASVQPGGVLRVTEISAVGPLRIYSMLLSADLRARRANVPDVTPRLSDTIREHLLYPFTSQE